VLIIASNSLDDEAEDRKRTAEDRLMAKKGQKALAGVIEKVRKMPVATQELLELAKKETEE